MPKPILDQLNRHVTAAVGSETYRSVMDKNGMLAATSTSEEMIRVMVETAEATGKLMRELGLPQLD